MMDFKPTRKSLGFVALMMLSFVVIYALAALIR